MTTRPYAMNRRLTLGQSILRWVGLAAANSIIHRMQTRISVLLFKAPTKKKGIDCDRILASSFRVASSSWCKIKKKEEDA